MNRKGIIISGIVLLIIVGILLYNNICMMNKKQRNEVEAQVEETYPIKIVEAKNCTGEKNIYYEGVNHKVYTYCIDSIKVEEKGNYRELKSLKERDKTLYQLLQSLEKVEIYKDGGSILYEDTKKQRKSAFPFRVLQCNRTNGTKNETNQDIYIGRNEMGYEKGFCEE